MQLWKISAGLTAAIAGAALLLGGARLDYLGPSGRPSSPNTASPWRCMPRSRSQPSPPPSTPRHAPRGSPTSDGGSISPNGPCDAAKGTRT